MGGRSRKKLSPVSENGYEQPKNSPSTINVGTIGIQDAASDKKCISSSTVYPHEEGSDGNELLLSELEQDATHTSGRHYPEGNDGARSANVFASAILLKATQFDYLEAVRSHARSHYACFPVRIQRNSKKAIEKWVTESADFTANKEEEKAIKEMLEGAVHSKLPYNAPILHRIRSEGSVSLNLENSDLNIPESKSKTLVAPFPQPIHPLNAHANLIVYTVKRSDCTYRSKPKVGCIRKIPVRNSKRRQVCSDDARTNAEDDACIKTICICTPCPVVLPNEEQCSDPHYSTSALLNQNNCSLLLKTLKDCQNQGRLADSRYQATTEHYPQNPAGQTYFPAGKQPSKTAVAPARYAPNVEVPVHPTVQPQQGIGYNSTAGYSDDLGVPLQRPYPENRTTNQPASPRINNRTYPGEYRPTNLDSSRLGDVPSEPKKQHSGLLTDPARNQQGRKTADSVKRDPSVKSSKQNRSTLVDRSRDASVNSKRATTANKASSSTSPKARHVKPQGNQTLPTVASSTSQAGSPIPIRRSAGTEARVDRTSTSVSAKPNPYGGSDHNLRSTATVTSNPKLADPPYHSKASGSDVNLPRSQHHRPTSTNKGPYVGDSRDSSRTRAEQVPSRDYSGTDRARQQNSNEKIARTKLSHKQDYGEGKHPEKHMTTNAGHSSVRTELSDPELADKPNHSTASRRDVNLQGSQHHRTTSTNKATDGGEIGASSRRRPEKIPSRDHFGNEPASQQNDNGKSGRSKLSQNKTHGEGRHPEKKMTSSAGPPRVSGKLNQNEGSDHTIRTPTDTSETELAKKPYHSTAGGSDVKLQGPQHHRPTSTNKATDGGEIGASSRRRPEKIPSRDHVGNEPASQQNDNGKSGRSKLSHNKTHNESRHPEKKMTTSAGPPRVSGKLNQNEGSDHTIRFRPTATSDTELAENPYDSVKLEGSQHHLPNSTSKATNVGDSRGSSPTRAEHIPNRDYSGTEKARLKHDNDNDPMSKLSHKKTYGEGKHPEKKTTSAGHPRVSAKPNPHGGSDHNLRSTPTGTSNSDLPGKANQSSPSRSNVKLQGSQHHLPNSTSKATDVGDSSGPSRTRADQVPNRDYGGTQRGRQQNDHDKSARSKLSHNKTYGEDKHPEKKTTSAGHPRVSAKPNPHGGSDHNLRSTPTGTSNSDLPGKANQSLPSRSNVKLQGSQHHLPNSTSKATDVGDSSGSSRTRADQVPNRDYGGGGTQRGRQQNDHDKSARSKLSHNKTYGEGKYPEKKGSGSGGHVRRHSKVQNGRGSRRKSRESARKTLSRGLIDTTTETGNRGAGIRGGGHSGLAFARTIISSWFKLSACCTL